MLGVRLGQGRPVARPLDVDLAYIYGYSFPRYRDGQVHGANELGLEHVPGRSEHYWRENDPDHDRPRR